jgi:two-component system CheB/CheR fusion protein
MSAKDDKKKTAKRSPQKTRKDKGATKRTKGESASETFISGQYTEKEFPIVGIGASAGGLKALEKFFDNMPPEENISFVVVQHLDPKHESLMPGLLEKHTQMKVATAKSGQKIEPNHLYIKPPGKDVVVKSRTLYLQEPSERKGVQLTIDIFFRSLAKDLGELAICVILSGAGSDGSLGLKSIKGEGGMAMVQEEKQAEYDGMPRSAINTGRVDYVLPVERMPGQLISYIRHLSEVPEKIESDEEKTEQSVNRILTSVRLATGHDFNNYKRSTVHRRIARRMAVLQLAEISLYAQYLRQNPTEIDELFKDLLINVTNFFRDSAAFEILERRTLPMLLEEKAAREEELDAPLRIWVPGCGTGEEAYSLAMLLVEAMERQGVHFRVQVFATDINRETIEFGRAGLYPDNIAADVSAVRLKRFFKRESDSYRIDRKIREMVVFAIHDLTRDPPFSRLDMVSCRNVLIYMNTPLQKRIIPLFHYSLREGGILFLGSSEGVGEFTDCFDFIDKKYKIYRNRKTEDRHTLLNHLIDHAGLPFHEPARGATGHAGWQSGEPDINVRRLVEQSIIRKYAPPSVLVDDKFQILYFHGDTSSYLKPPWGEPSFDLLRMATEGMHYKLDKALREVKSYKKPLTLENLKIRHNHEFLTIDVVLTPLPEIKGRSDFILITFEDKTPPKVTEAGEVRAEEEEVGDQRLSAIEHELDATRQELQATIEELETSNEELKSANEELQVNNEELQSTNEELESAKEELQSTNEELETVNEELQRKNLELIRAEDDMRNLFHATEIATIYLSENLQIVRFTPAATKIFNLREQDVGRPVSHITGKFDTKMFAEEAEKIQRSLEKKEWDVHCEDDRSFSVRMLPYRTTNNVIAGVVITIMEVTEARRVEQEAEKAKASFESVMDSIPDPLVVLDREHKVLSASRSFYELFRLKEKDIRNRELYKVGKVKWNISELRSLLNRVIKSGETVKDFKLEAEFESLGRKVLLLDADPIEAKDERPEMILIIMKDVRGKE